MVNQKYHVELSEAERQAVQEMLRSEDMPKSIRNRCSVLLVADREVGVPPTQKEIAVRCGVSELTVFNLTKQYSTEGIKACLRRRVHASPPNPPLVTGEKEARIIAMACGAPPKGYSRWSVRLLTERVIELQIVESIGRETIRTTLKKHNLNLI